MPMARAAATSRRCGHGALRPGFGEAGGDHDQRRARPCAAQARRPRSTAAGGTATTARSTASGCRSTDGTPRTPRTERALRVHRVDRAREVAAQQVGQHRVADLGRVGGGADHRDRRRVTARCDRLRPRPVAHGRRCTASDVSVGSMSNSRCNYALGVLPADLVAAARNTLTIGRFSGEHLGRRTCACPFSRAAAARCSSRIEPSPRPWWASSTTKATSAASVVPSGPGSRSYRPTAMISPPRRHHERHPVVVVDVTVNRSSSRRRDARVRPRSSAGSGCARRDCACIAPMRVGVGRAGSDARGRSRRRTARRRPPSARG